MVKLSMRGFFVLPLAIQDSPPSWYMFMASPLPCYCQDKKDILEIGSKVLSVEAILD